MSRLLWWAILLTGGLSTTVADVFMKKAATNFVWKHYLLGCFFYAVTIPGWYVYMKGTRFATCGVIYSVFTDSMILLIGLTYFREPVSLRQWLGIALGVSAVILLQGGDQ